MTALLPSQILDAAAAKIEPEGAWTQHWYWKAPGGLGGRDSGPISPDANCFCMIGAVAAVCGETPGEVHSFGHPICKLIKLVTGLDPASFNDNSNRTQAEVVTALRKAADLARERGE